MGKMTQLRESQRQIYVVGESLNILKGPTSLSFSYKEGWRQMETNVTQHSVGTELARTNRWANWPICFTALFGEVFFAP